MILVTGATGLVGSHLLVQLLQENEAVKALYRTEHQIEKTKNVFEFKNQSALFDAIKWVKGDLTDVPSLEKAFEKVTHVYHCAGLISFDPRDEEKLRKTNIEGTANVVNCCIAFGVKKLCHVSSIAALGDSKECDKIVTEENEWNPEKFHSDYAITKFGGEMEVWRANQEGLAVVIVNPVGIFGFGFPNQGSDVLIQSIKKGLLFYTDGNLGIIAVEDVVQCMQKLMHSSVSGERFILVGENISIKDFITYTARLLKVTPPFFLASKTMTNLGWKLDWFFSTIGKRKRKLTKATAAASHAKKTYTNQKVIQTLGVTFEKKENYVPKII